MSRMTMAWENLSYFPIGVHFIPRCKSSRLNAQTAQLALFIGRSHTIRCVFGIKLLVSVQPFPSQCCQSRLFQLRLLSSHCLVKMRMESL